jgi:hypothetical protein
MPLHHAIVQFNGDLAADGSDIPFHVHHLYLPEAVRSRLRYPPISTHGAKELPTCNQNAEPDVCFFN